MKSMPKVGEAIIVEECSFLFSSVFDEVDKSTKIFLKMGTKRD